MSRSHLFRSPVFWLVVLAVCVPSVRAHAACPAYPLPDCRIAERSLVRILDKTRSGTDPDRSDKLQWKWKRGAATTVEDFGDPVTGATAHSICVYENAAPPLAVAVTAPAGGTCRDGKPCGQGRTGRRRSR